MSLIKIADSCASSSTNRITRSPECRASQSLYETIAVSLFARLPPRAVLAASSLARDSCSATFSPRIFEQKRDCSQSSSLARDSCSATFSPRIFEQKRDCSQSIQKYNKMVSIIDRLVKIITNKDLV